MSNYFEIEVLLEKNVPASASCHEVNWNFKPADLCTRWLEIIIIIESTKTYGVPKLSLLWRE